MTDVISIISGKGGVGKTFFSINLSASLAYLGKKVLLVDANLTTPNISINLKVPSYEKTLHNVLKGEISMREAILNTEYGFDVIPSSLSIKDLIGTDPEKLSECIYEVIGLYDYIIIDTSAGLGRETLASIKASDKSITITVPEKAALASAYKAIRIAESLLVPVIGVVLNMYGQKSMMKINDVEYYLVKPVIGVIRKDNFVKESMEKGVPLIFYNKNLDVTKDVLKIVYKLIGEEYVEEKKKEGIIAKIISLFKWK